MRRADLHPRVATLLSMYEREDRSAAVGLQLQWMRDHLHPLLSNSQVPIFALFGNSDMSHNLPDVVSLTKIQWLTPAAPWARLADGTLLFGYSYVPLSNHRLKDWERVDTAQAGPGADADINGVRSSADGLVPCTVPQSPDETIEADIERALAARPDADAAKVIWATHAPPRGTHADAIAGGAHVGSVAIAEAIERHGPMATVHGHIHEAVLMSGGVFKGSLGARTTVYAVGNSYKAEKASGILIDTERPGEGERLELS